MDEDEIKNKTLLNEYFSVLSKEISQKKIDLTSKDYS